MSYYCERCEIFAGASDALADMHHALGHSLLAVGLEARTVNSK